MRFTASVAGPSFVNSGTADCPAMATAELFDRLSVIVSGLIARLEDPGACPPLGNYSEFSGFHDLSATEAEGGSCSKCFGSFRTTGHNSLLTV